MAKANIKGSVHYTIVTIDSSSAMFSTKIIIYKMKIMFSKKVYMQLNYC